MKFSSTGYPGKPNKLFRVRTGDPENPEIRLTLIGEVKKIATVIPGTVVLSGIVGETIRQSLSIVPNTKGPLELLKVIPQKGTGFKFELKETHDSGKKSYMLIVENTRESVGMYYDKISIITSRSDLAPLTINVSGNIKEADSTK